MPTIQINNEVLEYDNIIYVDAVNGNDTNGDGTEGNPYETVPIARDNVTQDNACIYIVEEGTYLIPLGLQYLLDTTLAIDYVVREDLVGDVIFNLRETDQVSDIDMLQVGKFIGVVFIRSGGGDQRVYEYFFNGSYPKLEFHNCVFSDEGSIVPTDFPIFTGNNTGNTLGKYFKYYNCSFIPVFANKDEAHPIRYGDFINSAHTTANFTDDPYNLNSVTLDIDYRITSDGWIDAGTGEDPDGSPADIGVYGGPYAWGEWGGESRSVTSTLSPIYSESEINKRIKIASSSIKKIRSGIGRFREVSSHIDIINSYTLDPEFAIQVRSQVEKVMSSTFNPQAREPASYIDNIISDVEITKSKYNLPYSYLNSNWINSSASRAGKGTRSVTSTINVVSSIAKKHYDRNTSSVMAIVSSAEIGPVTKAAISHININSDVAKKVKLTRKSYVSKIIADAITSSATPQGLERLPDTYNKSEGSNNWKLITVVQDAITEINQMIDKISKVQDIDEASGPYLDRHGENLQLKRGNKTDPIYRIALKAKLQRNISRGSVNEIIEIIATMLNIPVGQVKIEENPGDEPASVYIGVPIAPLAEFGLSYERFADIVDGILAGGVSLYSLTQGTYTYGDIDNEYNEAQGLADANDPERLIGGYFGAWAERGL